MSELTRPRPLASAYGNTGKPSNAVKQNKMLGIYLCTDKFEIPNSVLAGTWEDDLLPYLQDASLAAKKDYRIYPLMFNLGYTDNTAEASAIESTYKIQLKMVESPHNGKGEIENSGVEYLKNIRRFSKRDNLRCLILDAEFIGGEKTSTGVKGFECTVFAPPLKYEDGFNGVTRPYINLSLIDPLALTDHLFPITYPESVNISNIIYGVIDVELSSPSLNVVKATEKISGIDLYDDYATELADTDAWKITNKETGAAVAITSVVANSVYKGWTITPAEAVNIVAELVDPTALAALNVGSVNAGGYESVEGVSLGE